MEVVLTEIESAKATRYFATSSVMSYTKEVFKNDKEVTESDLSAAKAQVEYLEKRLHGLVETIDELDCNIKNSENSMSVIFSEAVRRLGESEDPGTYRVSVSEAGDVVSLRKEQ